MKYEFQYAHDHGELMIQVAANANTQDQGLKLANELLAKLKEVLTFDHQVAREAEVHILGGDRRPGSLSVEMLIIPWVKMDKAIQTLVEKGFAHGIDPYLEPK